MDVVAAYLPLNPGLITTNSGVNREGTTVSAGATLTLLNDSPGVPGFLSRLFVAQNDATGNGNCNNDIINIYVDGESSPSISFDAGIILGHYVPKTNMRVGTDHLWMGVDNTSSSGSAYGKHLGISYPIPYKSSIKVNYVCNSTASTKIWPEIDNVIGVTLPYRLKTNCVKFLSAVSKTAAQLNDNSSSGGLVFLNVPSGQGWIVSLCLGVNGSDSSSSYVETNIVMYRDGNTPNGTNIPNWQNYGVEDGFFDSWDFSAPTEIPINSPRSAVSFHYLGSGSNPYGLMAVSDYLQMNGGMQFSNGCVFKWEPGVNPSAPCTTSCNVYWCVFYYVPNP